MAVFTEELNTNYNFPNINIYNRYRDGVLVAYRAYPYDGYVMYDTTANLTAPKLDEDGNIIFDEDGNAIEVPVIQYFTMAGLSINYNFDNFSWVAVPRDSVDENDIYGDVDEPEHEVM